MSRARIATVAGDAEREAEVASRLTSDAEMDLVMRCVDRVEVLACIRGASLDVLVAVGPVPWFDLQCHEEATAAGVHLVGHAADPLEAEALEVAGFTVHPTDVALAEILDRPDRTREPSSGRAGGKLIAVWGPKGAPGRTTIAIELAFQLALTEPSTLLADADLYGGDVTQMLGLVEELPGLVAAARSAARGELLAGGWTEPLRRAPRGPAVLPGLLRPDVWPDVSGFGWGQALVALRRDFRYSVVDVGAWLDVAMDGSGPQGRNLVARTTVEEADVLVITVKADPIGLRSFFWALEAERELLDPERSKVVANRVRPGEEREVGALIRKHYGAFPVAFVPDRPDHIGRALWRAEPVALCDPGSPICDAIRRLAAVLGEQVPPRGWLAKLAGRRAGV